MNNPLVSIIIATHNRAGLLPEAVRSLQGQSMQDFEIILLDDASEDQTPGVIHKLCESDSRISSLRSAVNIGPGAARNLGIRRARGEFIAIMDDDDVALPNRLEVQSAALIENPEFDLVFSAVRWVDDGGAEIGKFPGILLRGEFPQAPEDVFRLLYLQSNKIPNTTIMARREVFIAHLYPEDPWVGEDWQLMMTLAASGVRFRGIAECLVDMRREFDHQSLMKRTEYSHQSQRQVLKMMRHRLAGSGEHRFDQLHRRAFANQLVREARAWSGFRGLWLVFSAILHDPSNPSAWDTLGWLLKNAFNRFQRLTGLGTHKRVNSHELEI